MIEIGDLRERIMEILDERLGGDREFACALEGEMQIEFIRHIAETGTIEQMKMARMVLGLDINPST